MAVLQLLKEDVPEVGFPEQGDCCLSLADGTKSAAIPDGSKTRGIPRAVVEMRWIICSHSQAGRPTVRQEFVGFPKKTETL